MTGVSKAETVAVPVAYCEHRECEWVAGASPGDDHPDGYCHRAASQHTRDTGHTTEVAVEHLTTYKPEVKP